MSISGSKVVRYKHNRVMRTTTTTTTLMCRRMPQQGSSCRNTHEVPHLLLLVATTSCPVSKRNSLFGHAYTLPLLNALLLSSRSYNNMKWKVFISLRQRVEATRQHATSTSCNLFIVDNCLLYLGTSFFVSTLKVCVSCGRNPQ